MCVWGGGVVDSDRPTVRAFPSGMLVCLCLGVGHFIDTPEIDREGGAPWTRAETGTRAQAVARLSNPLKNL